MSERGEHTPNEELGSDQPAAAGGSEIGQSQQALDPNDWTIGGNTLAAVGRIGSNNNFAIELEVNNVRALRIEPGTTPNLIGGNLQNAVSAAVVGAVVSGGGSASGLNLNAVYDNYGFVGGGEGNRAGETTVGPATGTHAVAVGGQFNKAAASYTAIVGGQNNNVFGNAVCSFIGGGINNEIVASTATIGGGDSNEIGVGNNGGFGTIGGGLGNTVLGDKGTIAGGESNLVRTGVSYGSIGGGRLNDVQATTGTIGGGESNSVQGLWGTVSGGLSGSASGWFATVPGGALNWAGGSFSFAAGRRAKASQHGCFTWGDSTDADVTCSGVDHFAARASGGVTFWTSPTLISGVTVSGGGNAWSSVSDRNAKRGFKPVDTRAVLDRLANIPITEWGYKSEANGIRHMGPMAQDFYAAFRLGDSDRLIATIDADGIALAAIQGLHRELKDLKRAKSTLETENAKLTQRMLRLEERMTQLGKSGAAPQALGVLNPWLGMLGMGCVAALVLTRRRRDDRPVV
ncbi:MAG TPA: tail fiber domain-containing protein [Polyangiaceae bacterium]|nr:tail fiber domain-containing protein [Polyangiaceae bacterium]